jgi:hypothetical protein
MTERNPRNLSTDCDTCKAGKPVRIATNPYTGVTFALPYVIEFWPALDRRRDIPIGYITSV